MRPSLVTDAGQEGARRGPDRGWARRLVPVLLAALTIWPAPPPAARAQEGCRQPSDDQIDAGAALEGISLVLHGLRQEVVPLDDGISFGDPGPCPGGSLDAFRGIDIMGWALEVSGPTAPGYCSPSDPPTTELPLRVTRCVEPSTSVASRNARVAFAELLPRAPFPLLLPTSLPDGLQPHWTTLRVTARRADAEVPRQYGTILRYRGATEYPWLLVMIDTGVDGEWLLDQLRTDGGSLAVRGRPAASFDGLPDYDGPGSGLVWQEDGLRVLLFGPYPPAALAAIAAGLETRAAAALPPEPPSRNPWR